MEVVLNSPMEKKDIEKLKIGNTVYISGRIYTARDKAHIRALEYYKEKKALPVSFKNETIFHCGPIAQKINGDWKIVAGGPTTSSRMNAMEPKFIAYFRPKAIIGKGGMDKNTAIAMKKYGCVYLAYVGGAGVLAAKRIKKVLNVHWFDLGVAEALWEVEAEKFGPLVVGIDTNGKNLYEVVDKEVNKNLKKVREMLSL
ncbi:MAG: FumA C-terminus/TtdB family hydratase beta subunit [Candidatus Thermoplasmatota archaeon]